MAKQRAGTARRSRTAPRSRRAAWTLVLVANTGSVPDALGLIVIAAAMVSLLAALGRRLAAPGPAGPVHTTRETR